MERSSYTIKGRHGDSLSSLKNINTGHKTQKEVNLKWIGVYSLSLLKNF
jgi:hypothetical protein